MSGIVLSSSVRQNLLSLQSTADLLATTQNRLSTGNKVNSALDSPTNFFTAQSLNNRASDISNLLDGVSNGVQVLQAANTGITSLQKLVDSAKSVATQALQTTVGYSAKSSLSTTITGATATDLRGTTSFASATATGSVIVDGTAGGATAVSGADTLGGLVGTNNGAVVSTLTAGTIKLYDTSGALGTTSPFADGDTLSVNGKTITFKAATAPTTAPTGSTLVGAGGNVTTDGSGNSVVYLGTSTTTTSATVNDVLGAIDIASGVAFNSGGTATSGGTVTNNSGQTLSSVDTTNKKLVLKSSTGADLSISGKADSLKAFGLTTATGSGTAIVTASRTTSSATVGSLVTDGSTLNVNGKTITFKNAPTPAASASHTGVSGNVETDGSGNSTVYLQAATVADVLKAIDLASGVQTAALSASGASLTTAAGAANSSLSASGALKLSTGVNTDLSISGTGNALSAFGLTGATGNATAFNASRDSAAGGVNGKSLSFTSFNGGAAVNVTFGDGTNGTVKTLDQLNAALLANNLSATLDSTGKLTISAGNDYASSTIGSVAAGGVIGGTLTAALTFSTATAPTVDLTAQATRANLVTQYNNILTQITTTSQDASFNGVNLLSGDQLKLTFNETGKSTLSVTGVNFNPAGLGLSNLTSGTDFIDNSSTNKVISSLTAASSQLRTQASALGSNLSIVQIRQDFSKNLINVLQTGSSNLTLADTNEEAANSQALSTRQSIAVSALALANQSQQSVLQLLR